MVRLQPQGGHLARTLCLLTAAVSLLLCAPAMGQIGLRVDRLSEAVTPDGRRPGVRVEFGFARTVVSDVWSPMRISITGGDEPVSGVVSVTYDNRRGGPMRIIAPYATAPGQTTQVEIALPLAQFLSGLVLRIDDERGRALRQFNIEDWTDIGVDNTPDVLPGGTVLIGAVSVPSLEVASREWIRVRGEALAEQAEQADPRVPIRPAGFLPEVVQTQLVPSDLSTIPAAYEMFTALVLGGDALQALSRAHAQAIVEWVKSGGRLVLVLDRPGPGFERFVPTNAIDAAVTPSLQNSGRVARPLSTSDDPVSRSWRVSSIDGVPMADGPVGLGWVVILGADPVPEVGDQAQVATAWDAALAPVAAAAIERAGEGANDQFWWWRGVGGRTSALLDALAHDLEGVSHVGFWPMLFLLLALAVLLGPVDYFVLKKRKALHRSWLTALGWIGLFSALGAVAPNMMRSDNTQLRRIRAVDVSQVDGVAMASGATGVFAGASGGVQITGVEPDSRWRPTQVRGAEQFGAPLALTRTSAGGLVPGLLPLRRWAFLTLLDETPTQTDVRATVDITADGQTDVRVTGVEGIVRSAAILSTNGWREIDLTRAQTGELTGVAGPILDAPLAQWTPKPVDERSPWMSRSLFDNQYEPWLAHGLPGFESRSDAIMIRIERGAEALVCIDIEDAAQDVSAAGVADQFQRTIYRILTPITPSASGATP